ncbi:maltose acetyltransferase domain-containing protein [Nocardia sp. NPDC052278]|uniref:maltose acetyltransferase domain-containing protein n=1 Tax=unclassified Nocardia TaxID=2637762 RepID=UPI0036BD64CE
MLRGELYRDSDPDLVAERIRAQRVVRRVQPHAPGGNRAARCGAGGAVSDSPRSNIFAGSPMNSGRTRRLCS